MTKVMFTKLFMFPLAKEALIQSGIDGLAISEEMMFEINGNIHVYSPGQGLKSKKKISKDFTIY